MTDQVPAPPYPRPPITEAVLAFHFIHHLDRRTIDRFARTHRKTFPAQEQMFDITIDPASIARLHKPEPKPSGFKLTNADKALVLIFRSETIAVSRLPPYTSWEDLRDHAKDVWADVKKIAGHPQLSRLSTRFINRLDIRMPPRTNPAPNEQHGLNLATYLQFGLTIPPGLLTFPMNNFHLVCQMGNKADTLKHTVQIGSSPSPLIDHLSFFLDIDVTTTDPISMRDKEIWSIVETLRRRKNEIFESSITDTTRRMFI